MMFSTGQLIFALLFVVTFVLAMVILYRKDRALHAKNYKGVKWVLIGFIVFVGFLVGIKWLLKN